MSERPAYDKGHVVSADGTTIGYRRMGSGPGLLSLHGGALASQHYLRRGATLADEFTVFLPDRRGRGLSGPFGDDYSIRTEDEDLTALVAGTGARYAFGSADGGLFALHAAMSAPELEKIAVYEPVIFVGQEGLVVFSWVIDRLNRRLDEGDIADAMLELTKDSKVSRIISATPDALLRPVSRWVLRQSDRKTTGDDTSLRDLLPTLRPELAQVRATEGTIEDYRKVSARVLLIRGTRAQPMVKGALAALQEVLPDNELVVLPRLRHGSAQDQGSPKVIADTIRPFFRS